MLVEGLAVNVVTPQPVGGGPTARGRPCALSASRAGGLAPLTRANAAALRSDRHDEDGVGDDTGAEDAAQVVRFDAVGARRRPRGCAAPRPTRGCACSQHGPCHEHAARGRLYCVLSRVIHTASRCVRPRGSACSEWSAADRPSSASCRCCVRNDRSSRLDLLVRAFPDPVPLPPASSIATARSPLLRGPRALRLFQSG